MPTRSAADYLASGEVSSFKKGGTTADDELLSKGEADDLFKHALIMEAVCTAASQGPTELNTPHQIIFGPAQGDSESDVELSAAGEFTFHKSGEYLLSLIAHYGREGSTGASILMFRLLKNGLPYGLTLAAKVTAADYLAPWSVRVPIDIEEGDVVKCQIIRDGAGNNSGGLYAVTSDAGWATAPCAAMNVFWTGE